MIQSSHEETKYRSFIQPQKGPSTNRGDVSTVFHNRSHATNTTGFIDYDYSEGVQDRDQLVNIQTKLSQLQRWINNINEEIVHDRRDLMMINGKTKSLDIELNFYADQAKKACKGDMNKVQQEMDRIFKVGRKDAFELQQQVDKEIASSKQLKKDVVKCQRRTAAAEVEIGKGNVKRTKEKQIRYQERKQEMMEKSMYDRPNTTFTMQATFQNQQ